MICFSKQCKIMVSALLLLGCMSITDASAQINSWSTFEEQIFQLAGVVVQNLLREDGVPPEEMIRARQELKEVDALFYASTQQCPSAEVCEALRIILQRITAIIHLTPGGVYLLDDEKIIAALRQAVHSHQTRARVLQEPTAATASSQQPSDQQPQIEFLYAYRPKGQEGGFFPLENNGTMHSGDYYKIFFRISEECYVYIFQLDSSNNIYGLFPLENFRGVPVNLDNPVEAATEYAVPAQDKSFVLDQQVGEEFLYFLVLRERDLELEKQYELVLKAQNENDPKRQEATQTALLKSIRQKGPTSIAPDNPTTAQPSSANQTTWQEAGETFSLLRQRLVGNCKDCVHVLSFRHQ